jgi:gas vesicle protein
MGKTVHVIAAAAAGFIAGILLAPKSGEDTRRELKERALGAKEYAGEKAEAAKAAAREAGVTLKKSAGRAEEEIVGFSKSAKSSAARVADEASKLGDEAKARANRVADEAKRTATQIQKDAEKHLR